MALNRKKSVVVARFPALGETQIPSTALQILREVLCPGNQSDSAPVAWAETAAAQATGAFLPSLPAVSRLERIQTGLQDYF